MPSVKVPPLALALAAALAAPLAAKPAPVHRAAAAGIGRHVIRTVPFDPGMTVLSSTYTPSGKVLVAYAPGKIADTRQITLATMDDDGSHLRPFLLARIPDRPKDNGIRYMVFPDDRRVLLGDFVVECRTSLETCHDPELLPVDFPAEVAGNADVANRWSEVVVAPDNRHVAWTTLLANYSAIDFTGELVRSGDRYRVAKPQIVSSLDPFLPDPRHADGVIPQTVRGGEVKQFVHGGTALSLAGAVRRDTPDSVVQDLASGRVVAITDDAAYTETTIVSPDERLGLTMTTRFSPGSNLAILGLMPRPYPVALNMGLPLVAYTHAVTGVRRSRPGNVGPALIDIRASQTQPGYRGANLNTSPDWVFYSPMSWAPSSRKAMWMEARRGDESSKRIRVVELPGYPAGPAVAARATPAHSPDSVSDLSAVHAYATSPGRGQVRVYGHASGYIVYGHGADGRTEKRYVKFSDDGRSVYSGEEVLQANPRGRSTYSADIALTGPKPGRMAVTLTFGPLGGPAPAALVFDKGADGRPLTRGYAEFGGQRLEARDLAP